MPRTSVRARGAVAASGVAIAALVLSGCTSSAGGTSGSASEASVPAPSWVRPAPTPPKAEEPGQWIAGVVDPEWVAEVSDLTGIPERQLASYAGAQRTKRWQMSECRFSWTTLAAIGKVESDHGRHDGSSVAANGDVSPAIFGVALDGDGVALIEDTDDGEIDGDDELDRAVGPFQLLPETWENWHTDGNGDGVQDPQNFDDAAMAATNYLCRASSPQNTEEGWRAAITAYNVGSDYLEAVARYAAEYREAALAVRDLAETDD